MRGKKVAHLWKKLLKDSPIVVCFFCGRSVFRVDEACMHQHGIRYLSSYKQKWRINYTMTAKEEASISSVCLVELLESATLT